MRLDKRTDRSDLITAWIKDLFFAVDDGGRRGHSRVI